MTATGQTLLVDDGENEEQLPEGNSEVLRIYKVDKTGTLANDKWSQTVRVSGIANITFHIDTGARYNMYLHSGIFIDYQLTWNFTSLREP